MKYAGIIKNDTAAAPGISYSFYTQGCPFHCAGCHNPETWDYNGGKEFTPEVLQKVLDGVNANNIDRPFCLLGGEPLCPNNRLLSCLLVKSVKEKYPKKQIYCWTGYKYEDLKDDPSPHIQYLLDNINVLIDGPFILALRDITLPMRGSSNQRIINLEEKRNERN